MKNGILALVLAVSVSGCGNALLAGLGAAVMKSGQSSSTQATSGGVCADANLYASMSACLAGGPIGKKTAPIDVIVIQDPNPAPGPLTPSCTQAVVNNTVCFKKN